MADPIEIRPLREDDSFEAMTALLHRAYRPLAAAGMRFLASWQDAGVTRSRATGVGKWTLVACRGPGTAGEVVGCITIRNATCDNPCEHYRRAGAMIMGQFAVEPSLQRSGLGSRLLSKAEALAVELGAVELLLDTSEHAAELIAFYTRRRYEPVGHTRWESVNYRSIVMRRSLPAPSRV